MSVSLLPFVDAPALQKAVNEIYTLAPKEPSPEVQFLTSAINTNRVLETTVVPGKGQVRRVDVIYTPRITESEIGTSITADCDDGAAAGDLTTTYEIDTTVGVQHKETVALVDLKERLESDEFYFARRTLAILDVCRRKMATQAASQMALLSGRFATDNGEKNLSGGNYLKTVATKFAAAIDGGKPNPEALQEIAFSARNSGFSSAPWVFGYGEIFRYMQLLGSMNTFSDGGLDFVQFVQAMGLNFLPSHRVHTALNGNNPTNKFLVVDPGALHLLQYNKFDSPAARVSQDNLVMGILADPLTGVEYNYKYYLNPCGEKITILVSTAFKVVGLPDDLYAAGDRLEETNGVLQFAIVNS
jgi:hypothetical protein